MDLTTLWTTLAGLFQLQDINGTKNTNSSQIIRNYGYSAEEHTVITSDGFMLGMFRIPSNGPPVLIIHGLLSCSDDFLVLGANKSLPILLAELGHDVWLGNLRGNTYSRNHENLSPDSALFWDFSWHEMGLYDLPAMIDYILDKANVSKLSYIGHSQGTTTAFVMLSEKTEMNDKINVVVSLAPISWISNLTTPVVKALAKPEVREGIEIAFKALNITEVLPHRPPFSSVMEICSSSALLSTLCLTVVFFGYGFDYKQIDYENTENQFWHFLAGSSFKQINHYLLNIESKLFQKYDYGSIDNIEKYGSKEAPSYPVGNITSRQVFIWGKNDWLSNIKDIQQLNSSLPNGAEVYEVDFANFNHMDFLWAKHANNLVYEKVIEVVNKYSGI